MAKKQSESTAADSVILELPLGDLPEGGYEADAARVGRIDLHLTGRLGGPAAQAVLRLRAGLRAARAELANGRPVHTSAEVIRWLFEQVAAQAPAKR